MSYVLVRHRIRDLAQWKPVFEEHGKARRAASSKGGHVFRSADDPQQVIVLLEWDSHEKARRFTQSQDLKSAMERAGVADQPDIYFLDQVERPRA